MRVIVEALGAGFGGIRTYVDHLLAAWPQARPDDELLVLADPAHGLATGRYQKRELSLRGPDVLARPVALTLRTRALVRAWGADVVLATHPVTGLLDPGVPVAVVVHDLRHELLPDQFSRARRALRQVSYGRSYRLAAGFVAVSERTRGDLHRLHPGLADRPSAVVHHGADHALAWPGTPLSGNAVTFAHHSNKNADLVIDGWARARRAGVDIPRLVVLGGGGQSAALRSRAAELGIDDAVEVAGWLPDDEFQALVGSARVIVLSSDFEGFGLPVVEAMVRGIPALVGPDPAVLEVAGGHAAVMADWTPSALADALGRALAMDAPALEAARVHAGGFTWRRSAAETAAFLEALRR